MRVVIASIALLLAPGVCADSVTSVVPDAFLGEWASRPGLCASEQDDLVLRISRTEIGQWESHGPIRAVVVLGNSEISMIAELSDEAETWLSAYTLRLSEDGLRLTDVTSRTDPGLVRYKCDGTSQGPSNNSFNVTPDGAPRSSR